jgi:hypothetical protein
MTSIDEASEHDARDQSLLQRLARNLFGSEDDFEDDEVDDEGFGAFRPDLVAQSLKNPLIDTPLLKVQAVLEKRIPDPNVRSKAGHFRETRFVQWMKTTFPNCSYRPWTAETTVKLIIWIEENSKGHEMASNTVPVSIWKSFMKNWAGNVTDDTFSVSDIDPLTKSAWNAWREIQLAWNIRRADSMKGNPDPFTRSIAGKTFLVTSKLVAFERSEGVVAYGSSDMFLAVHDSLQARFGAHLALDILRGPTFPEQLTHSLYIAQCKWQEQVILKYKNPGYEVAKAPESLWKCYSSRLAGGSYEENDAYARMVAKTKHKETAIPLPESAITGEFLTDRLDEIIRSVTDVATAVEMSGLIKNVGHPIIDPISSGLSTKTYGRARDKAIPSVRNKCVYVACHLILKNYIAKEGKWPPLYFERASSAEPSRLETLRNAAWLDLTDGAYPLEDWEHAQFGKFREFNYHEDYLPLIKDSSCAPPLSMLKNFYDGKGAKRSMRRLLLRIIESDDIDTRKLVSDVSQNIIDPDDLLILLYPKECEFKLSARMFCMLSLRLRLFFSIVSENTKEGIYPYLPYTSMVMSNAELQETLLKMTGPAGDETLFIEVDLSRWNLCFRDSHMKPLGERFDAIFGVENVFGRAHEIFSKSLLCTLVPDSRVDALEDPVDFSRESDNCYPHHEGGLEGIDQPGWTSKTIAELYWAMWGEKVRFKLLGQGDNQTLAIVRAPGDPEPMSDFSNRIMAKIEKTFADMNHVAKPEEFVNSTKQLTYGKVFYVSGKCYPMTLKYASKISTVTSSDIVTFSDASGSIFSSSVGSAMNSRDPLRVWLLSMIHANQFFTDCMKGDSFFGFGHTVNNLTRSDDMMTLLLTIPSVLGGLPISTATNFICRNEPDPLTSALAFLQCLDLPVTSKYLMALTKDVLYSPKPKIETLIMDPFALPLISPVSPATLMHEAALPLVRGAANRDISQLVSWSTSQESSLLREALVSTRPFFPVVLRDVYDVSALGKAEELQKMFTLTRTFIQAAKNHPVETDMISADQSFVSALSVRFHNALRQNKGSLPRRSSLKFAQELRTRWGVEKGVIQGIEAEHPLDHVATRTKTGGSGVVAQFVGDIANWVSKRGPARIYLGGKTQERRVKSGYELKPVPALSALKKLVLATTAGEMTEDVWKVFRYVCSTRTPHTLENLCTVMPRTGGGVIAHRYDDMQSSGMIGPVGNLSHGAYIVFSSDRVEGISGGKVDYPVAFQQFFSYLSALGRQSLFSDDPSPDSIIIPLSAADMEPLVQERLELTKPVSLPALNTELERNRFCYVPEVEIILGTNMYRGRIVETSKALSRPALFLAGAIITEQLASSLSRAKLEMTEDERPTYAKLDVAVFSALGSKVIHTALTISGAWIATFNYFRLMGDAPTRYSSTSLVYRIARNLSNYMTANVLKDPEAAEWINREDLFSVRGGVSGFSMATEAYERNLAENILNLLFSPLLSGKNVEPILPAVGKGLDKVMVARLFFSRALWIVSVQFSETREGTAKRAFREISRILKKSQHLEQSELLEDELKTRLQLSTLGDTPVKTILSEAMDSQFMMRSLKGVNLSVEEMFRSLRSVKRVPLLPVIEQNIFTHVPKQQEMEFEAVDSHGPPITPPWILPDVRLEQSLTGRITEWSRRVVGLHATSFIQWADVLPEGKGNALVVGTGAGGIQRLLMDKGWGSQGLDLSKTIPIEIRQKGEGSPPECSLYCPRATYAPESLFSSGDWFNESVSTSVLSRMNPDMVVVDIENKEKRFALELIRPLLRFQFSGAVFFSVICNKEEAGAIFAFLRACSSRAAAFRLAAGSSSDEYVKVAFHAHLVSSRGMNSSPRLLRAVYCDRLRYPEPKQRVRIQDLLPHLCGELIRGCSTITETQNVLIKRLRDSQGSKRGKVSGSRFIALLESYAALKSVSRAMKKKTYEERVSKLAQEIEHPKPIKLDFLRYAIEPGRNSDYYSRTLTRIGGRILGCSS